MNYPPLAPSPFYLYNIPMSSCRTGFPQYKKSLSTTQMPAYLQKGLDMIASNVIINSATQQLSNSATQQLSNSATQQLSNSATQQLSTR